MSRENIILLELDICVPVQEFKIEYTLVDSGGLAFVPEFILRLLKISAFLPSDIATYFGFSTKELEVALTPLFQNKQIATLADTRIGLSEKGHVLFADDENNPKVKSREEYRKSFVFDLLSFSCLGTRTSAAHPERSVVIDVGIDARSESTLRASQAFQRNYLDKIYDRWDKVTAFTNGADTELQKRRPELYKIGNVERKRDSYQSVQEQVIIDGKNADVCFAKIQNEMLEDITHSSQYLSQRASKLSQYNSRTNVAEISRLAELFDDAYTLDLLSGDGIDLQKIFQNQLPQNKTNERIFGSSQLKQNWDNSIYELLKKHTPVLLKQAKDNPVNLYWVIPASNGLWSKNSRHGQVLDEVAQLLKQEKSNKLIFELFYPIGYTNDNQTIKRAEKECIELRSHLNYFIESEKLSPLEIIVLDETFAVVIYHLCNPDRYPTPIPFGFITHKREQVKKINDFLKNTLSEYVSVDEPRMIRGGFVR